MQSDREAYRRQGQGHAEPNADHKGAICTACSHIIVGVWADPESRSPDSPLAAYKMKLMHPTAGVKPGQMQSCGLQHEVSAEHRLVHLQVRRTMARIKLVLTERAIAEPDAQRSRDLRLFVNAL